MNIEKIKDTILISDFLARLGYAPSRKSGGELFYSAPHRRDDNPSMTVNDSKGLWFDHGDGKGGNIIDLGLLVFNTSDVKEVVQKINSIYGEADISYMEAKRADLSRLEQRKAHELVKVQPLGKNLAISSYLDERGVLDAAIRTNLIKEVYYDYTNDRGEKKRFFGAGWQNRAGGWEVRSKYGKVCIASRDVTFLSGTGNDKVNVFEGMMDFLTAIQERTASVKDTNIILNGLAMYEQGISLIRQQPVNEINLFFDHGEGGDKFTASYKEHFPNAIDKRELYKGYGDYNEMLMSTKSEKKNEMRR